MIVVLQWELHISKKHARKTGPSDQPIPGRIFFVQFTKAQILKKFSSKDLLILYPNVTFYFMVSKTMNEDG